MPRKPRPVLHAKTSIRLPPGLKESIQAAAAHNGRSANEEMLARLATPDDVRLAAMEAKIEELMRLVRLLLDERG